MLSSEARGADRPRSSRTDRALGPHVALAPSTGGDGRLRLDGRSLGCLGHMPGCPDAVLERSRRWIDAGFSWSWPCSSRPSAPRWSSSTPRAPTPGPRRSSTPSRCSRRPRSSTRARPSRTRARRQARAADGAPRPGAARTAQTSTDSLAGKVALGTIYPGEQIIAAKFGGQAGRSRPRCRSPKGMIAVSVNLTDPARVAGFVNPGSEVAIFLTGADDDRRASRSPGCCSTRVTVLGVGSTTPVSTTTTDETGASTTEQLPRTLLTLAVDQEEAQKVLFASAQRRAGLRPADRGEHRPARHRVSPPTPCSDHRPDPSEPDLQLQCTHSRDPTARRR